MSEQDREPYVYALVVGRLVGALRERSNLSQATLAEQIGMTQPTLSRVERGQAQLDVYTFSKVARVFGMTGSELMHHVEQAMLRTEQAAAGVVGGPPKKGTPWWQAALAVGGLAGLAGLVAFAVSAALDDKRKGR